MASFFKFVHRQRQAFVGVGIAGLCCASLYPQTIGLYMYKTVIAEHKDGTEKPISKYLQQLSQQVLDSVNLTPDEEASIDFFSAYGNDMLHKGSVNLRTGAVIGVPVTFNYTAPEQVIKDAMLLDQRDIDWDSGAGKQLLSAVILSEQSKRFAIAREIYYTKMQHVWVDGGFRAGIAFLAYASGFAVNNLLELQTRMKRWGRVGLYGVIGVFYLYMYFSLSDAYFCGRDMKADKKAADLGKEYAQGGVEYYDKILKRNIAIRQLMGAEGTKHFTLYGNEIARFRQKHVQYTARKDNLVKLLKDWENKETVPKVEEEECIHCK